ncbi:16S rRNA (cytidine1402-2'-O)-methyltransferase [Hydrogenoanaerobacterium saccharovorans]|uniref:Ribosomal RNA small subunit methyltransferase I n=1 Tax=Hydrogenoanaerobacterium saccharovorans TaxID=474960 RepID=A0A1H8AJJ2_9FIRM|nr:16S rRNA (cytidine(1402)-2'-O)-methyltransferase [Hydrogenoanaerobacterium saccharovorans]RPF47953.1 16S rRNA (cytidine1402-2'-O)-methyltransferase [Hydrogenoanaerobacterium saccharovorans]SEM69959.1 16S rRNA (cytidine1402-2'-O)-methyltransferase [Hydrogenoanaerobacterium saccharovorans]
MAGKLFVVGTPIGNLGDMTPRAVQTLRDVDFIAAEDTRVTQKLLNHFEIKKHTISYHQHSQSAVSEQITERILAGENCAVVTDAGMPCISDPGEDLVRLCAERGVEIVVVPGPSAVVSALAVSGLLTSRFAFEGFLSTNRKNRLQHLESIKNDRHTLIFYEAPHKLITTLQDMQSVLGERRVALARELTKLHEEVIRTTFSGALELYREKSPRGEYVLVIEGAPEQAPTELTFEDAVGMVCSLVQDGESITNAAKQTAKETGYKKGDLYKAALEKANK